MEKHILHEKYSFRDMRELIKWAAVKYDGKNAYSFKSNLHKPDVTRITFNTLRDDVREMTTKLIDMGCSGKHCVVIGKLSYEWAVLYFSILSANGVIVSFDRDWHGEELAKTANKADAAFLFCDEDISDKAEIIAVSNSLEREAIFMCGRGSGKGVDSLLGEGRDLFNASPDAYFNNEIDPHKMSLLIFTSGTTGEGKGGCSVRMRFSLI